MVTVRDSRIHGKGLFATQPIRKNTLIGRLEGRRTRRNGPHVLWINKRVGIEGANDIRYVNHCSSPNACYYDDGELIALRDIAADEEITHHYGDGWD